MKTLLERLRAPMPTFWLRVRAFFVVLALIGASFVTFKDYVPGVLQEPAKYCVAIGIVVGFVASFAKKDASDIVKIDIPKALAAQVSVSLNTPADVPSTAITVEQTSDHGTVTTISPDGPAEEA